MKEQKSIFIIAVGTSLITTTFSLPADDIKKILDAFIDCSTENSTITLGEDDNCIHLTAKILKESIWTLKDIEYLKNEKL